MAKWLDKSTLLLSLLASSTFSLLACGGDDETMPPTFSDIQSTVFVSCTQSSCHDSTGPTGDLDLSAGASYENLVNVDPDNAAAKAMGFKRVVAGDTANSFLVKKLKGDLDTDQFGDIMPFGTSGLDAERLKMIEDWILDGAQNN